ncbi:MAG: hypothetical protein R3B07_36415, partial [Polyangiaceae bacterium]
ADPRPRYPRKRLLDVGRCGGACNDRVSDMARTDPLDLGNCAIVILTLLGAPWVDFEEHALCIRHRGFLGGEERVLYAEMDSVSVQPNSLVIATSRDIYEVGPFDHIQYGLCRKRLLRIQAELETRRATLVKQAPLMMVDR